MPCLIKHNEIDYSLELSQRAFTPNAELAIAPYLRLQHKAVALRGKLEREDAEIVRNISLRNKCQDEINKATKVINQLKKTQDAEPAKEGKAKFGSDILEHSNIIYECTNAIQECNSMVEEILSLNDNYMSVLYDANNALIKYEIYSAIIKTAYDLPIELMNALNNNKLSDEESSVLHKDKLSSENVKALCLFFLTNAPLSGIGLMKKTA